MDNIKFFLIDDSDDDELPVFTDNNYEDNNINFENVFNPLLLKKI